MSADDLREAYRLGADSALVRGASNPYLPADEGTRRMYLARCWQSGRGAAFPDPLD